MIAHDRFTARAPAPASESGNGEGGTGTANLRHAVQSVATPGTSRTPDKAMPIRARYRALQSSVKRIRKLTAVSSRKSMLSANRGHRSNRRRHGELNSKVGEVEDRRETNDAAHPA